MDQLVIAEADSEMQIELAGTGPAAWDLLWPSRYEMWKR